MKPRTVLLLDPDRERGPQLEAELARLGCEVYRVYRSGEAVDLLKVLHPGWTVVAMDVNEEGDSFYRTCVAVAPREHIRCAVLARAPYPEGLRPGDPVFDGAAPVQQLVQLLVSALEETSRPEPERPAPNEMWSDDSMPEVAPTDEYSRWARSNTPEGQPAAEWRGNLEEVDPARIMVTLATRRATGELLATRESWTARIWFYDGYPVAAESNAVSSHVADALFAEGLLTRRQLERYRDTACSPRPGERLHELGVIRRSEIEYVDRFYFRKVISDLFHWESGAFSYLSGMEDTSGPPFPMQLGPLLTECISEGYSVQTLARLVGPTGAVPRWVGGRKTDGGLGHDDNGRRIMEHIDQRASVGEIAMAMGHQDPRQVYAVVYPLVLLGVIATDVTLQQMAPPTPTPASQPSTPEERRIREMYSRAMTADYFTIFGISRDGNDSDIRSSYERLRREFAAHTSPGGSGDGLKPMLDVIQLVLREAHEALADPVLRGKYRQHLG